MGNELGKSTSSNLLQGLRESDKDAWQHFVDLYKSTVYAKCRNNGLSDEDAADVARNVFKDVARAIPEFERVRTGQFRKWPGTITKNRIIDHFRHNAQQTEAWGGSDARRQMEQVAGSDVDDSLSDAASERVIDQLFEALEAIRRRHSDQVWHVFWRTQLRRESPTDVAKDLDISLDNVYQIKSRILRELRQRLDLPDSS